MVTTAVEHDSVLKSATYLGTQGFEIRLAPPGPDGAVNVDALLGMLDESVFLVSCMMVNSETGAVTDIPGLAGR